MYIAVHIIMPDQYRNMADNFRGVLIFVIFTVNLAVTKSSHAPMKINAYDDMVLCESMMMGVAINVVAARPTLSSVSKQQ